MLYTPDLTYGNPIVSVANDITSNLVNGQFIFDNNNTTFSAKKGADNWVYIDFSSVKRHIRKVRLYNCYTYWRDNLP